MNKKLLSMIIAVSLLAAVGAIFAVAHTATAQIPFEFRAGKKVLPAGTYIFDASHPKKVVICNQKGVTVAEVPVPTRLAQRDHSSNDASLVFDKVENEHFLAEFWLPGVDGFFLVGAQIEHTHVAIKATQ
jgi:hypothetical protein